MKYKNEPVSLPAGVTGMQFRGWIMHSFVDSEEAQIAEDAVAHFALEVALLVGDMLVQMLRQFVPLFEQQPAHITYVHSELMHISHVSHDHFIVPRELKHNVKIHQ